MKPDMRETITFTREQLYELVWKKPMSRLAQDYSISDVGLSKICARAGIPTPPRGYWARLEAGRAPPKPALPPATKSAPIEIPVEAREVADPEIRDEVAAQVAEERKPENRIVVAERLQSPCPVVEAARAALQIAKPDHLDLLASPPNGLQTRVSAAQLPRAMRIADALFKSFAGRGWELTVHEGKTFVALDPAFIAVTIEEGLRTESRPAETDLQGMYRFHYKRHESVRRPSGHLCVSISEKPHLWQSAHRRKWSETEQRPMETRLNDVVVGMLRLAAAVREDEALKEAAAQQAAKRERERQEALERERKRRAAIARVRERVEELRDQARRWSESDTLRRFVARARKQGQLAELDLKGQDLERWAEWALQQADRLDPFEVHPPSVLDDEGVDDDAGDDAGDEGEDDDDPR